MFEEGMDYEEDFCTLACNDNACWSLRLLLWHNCHQRFPAASASPAVSAAPASASGVEDGVLTVAMECAYSPYNWTQTDDSNGAVAIKGSAGDYANGYDVMMAKKLCEANGWKLEVVRLDWNSLVPAVQTDRLTPQLTDSQ